MTTGARRSPRHGPRAATSGRIATGAFALLTSLVGTLQLGCAARSVETETTPRAAADAGLRVVNRTSSDVRVEADGRSLGEVPAGREHYFVGIAPGTFDLRGVSLDGALTFQRSLLTLAPGETFTWVLREADVGAAAGGQARPRGADSRNATLVVENGTDSEVEVLLDGQVLGTTAALRSGRFEGIAPGAHSLEARAKETSFPPEYPVLEAGETFTWRLREPGTPSARGILPSPGTGRLRVDNPNSEPVIVLVNDVELGQVEAGEVRIFDELRADRVRLAALSRDGRTLFGGPEVLIEAGGVTEWRVGPGAPRPIVRPSTDTAARAEARPVPPPIPAIEESGPGGEPELDDAEAEAGEEVIIRGGGGDTEPEPSLDAGDMAGKAFIVENHTMQDLEIFFDGRRAGVVGAGETARFTELPGPRFTPSAKNASGAREYPHPQVDLSSRDTFSWIIEP